MIIAEGLTRKYGDFVAVDNVSFSIPRGQVVGLLGHNGAGKTTIMKTLTGFLEPSAGTIKVAGVDVVQNRLQVQEKIGYLPEVPPIYPEQTVAEYLEYIASLRGCSKSDVVELIREAVEKTGLSAKITSKISTLSKGYKQRLGVAQAILHKPEVLVLDEPTSGLDPSQINEMRSLLRSLSESSTVIISTHILQEVEAICDRVIIILNGRVAADANLEDLRDVDCIKLEVDKDLDDVSRSLRGFEGILSIDKIAKTNSGFCYEIKTAEHPNNIIPRLTYTAISNGWQLYHVGQEHRTLEVVFREINSSFGA